MKRYYRLFLLVSVVSVPAFFLADDSAFDPNKRVLLIFLDNSEAYVDLHEDHSDVPHPARTVKSIKKQFERPNRTSANGAAEGGVVSNEGKSSEGSQECYTTGGAITDNCLSAIIAKGAPILASGSIVYNLLTVPFHNSAEQEDRNFVRAIRMFFNDSNWLIKKVKQRDKQVTELYCMIPADYLIDQKKKSVAFERNESDDELGTTSLEYQLGLRFDHMESIPMQNRKELITYFKQKYKKYNEKNFKILDKNTGGDFIKYLPDIFVLNTDYNERGFKAPAQSIYISGHGSYDIDIAQLSFEDFSIFLDFLEKKIKTAFLVYLSCYAAGYNAQQVYGELTKKGALKTYSFAIATQAISDVAAWSACNEFKDGIIASNLHYDVFIKNLLKDVLSYKEALAQIMPQVKKVELVTDIPQIRFPFVPAWFPVTESDKAVISITKTMVKTRQKPLAIKAYNFNGTSKDPAAILLYDNQVPFALHINTRRMPTLISMVAGKTEHIIKEIEAENSTLENFFRSMSKIDYGVEKDLFIKNIKTKNGLLSDVLIHHSGLSITFQFTIIDHKSGCSTQKSGTIEMPNGKPIIVEKAYTVPEKYASFEWEAPFTIARYSDKNRVIPALVDRSRAVYEIKNSRARLSKAVQLIKSLFLHPKFGYADRRSFRFLLQQLEKNQMHALNYAVRVIQAVGAGNMEEAIKLVNEAYGKSKPIGFDFTLKDFYQFRWLNGLFGVMGSNLFDFLDLYTLKK